MSGIEFEALRDLCPVCHVSGMQPCVDPAGADTNDHEGRPVDQATS